MPMINSKRNIFFTLLLNLFNILIIIISGITIIASSSLAEAFIIPILGMFFIPLGASILAATHKTSVTIISLTINFIAALIIFRDIPIALTAFLFSSTAGVVIGYLIKRNVALGLSCLLINFTYFILMILSILILCYWLENKSIFNFFYDGYNNFKQIYNSTYSEEFKNLYMLPELPYFNDILKAFPAIAAELMLIGSFIYYFITNKIIRSLNFNVKAIKPFNKFYISNLIGAFLILTISIAMVVGHYGYLAGEMIGNAGFSIIEILLVVNGAAFLYNLLSTKFNIGTTKAVFILIFLVYLLTPAITIIGFVEMILDFRKLDPNRIFQKKRG